MIQAIEKCFKAEPGAIAKGNSCDKSEVIRLGDLSVMRVESGPKRFFIALHGSNTVRHVGQSFHRRYFEDCVPAHARSYALEPYETCLKYGKPVYSLVLPGTFNGTFRKFERLLLPLTEDAADRHECPVDRLLVWVGPSQHDDRAGGTVYGTGELAHSDTDAPSVSNSLVIFDVDDPARTIVQACVGTLRPGAPSQRSVWSRIFGFCGREGVERCARESQQPGATSPLRKPETGATHRI